MPTEIPTPPQASRQAIQCAGNISDTLATVAERKESLVARLHHSPGSMKALLVELIKYRATQEEEIQLALRCGRGFATVNARIQANLANILAAIRRDARNRAAMF
jgi:hypothetical protein